MRINSDLVKTLRAAKNWSQEQLSEICGLSLRTIQRLENSGNASIESVRVLAATFEIDPKNLRLSEEEEQEESLTPLGAMKLGLNEFANFSGKATRFEFWWFLLFVVVVLAISTILHEKAYQIAGVILFLPLLAASTRRLNDAGYTLWWQFLWIVPFGQFALFYLLAQPSNSQVSQPVTKSLEPA